MYERILVPLDGSPLAEQVLPYVRLLAQKLGAPVDLVRVFDRVPPGMADPQHHLYLDQVALSLRNEAEDYLNGVAADLQKDGITASVSVHEGDHASHVASSIVAEAEKEPGTLLAMCTHGRSGLGRWVMGSISDKVMHATTEPLLLVRARKEDEFSPQVSLQTLIVPLDGSDLAEEIVPHAVSLARALALKVLLVAVTPPVYASLMAEGAAYGAPTPELPAEPDAATIEYLARVAEGLRGEGIASVEEKPLYGPPAEVILDMALSTPDSLVAMTTHGRSGLGRWLLGSVAERVVRYSGGPVLLHRAAG
jgi:nucleotide-binding universal stress UspA family protein